MGAINYSEMHLINLPVEHMNVINKLIDPASYLRLFTNKIIADKKNDSGDKSKSNNNREKNLYNDLEEIKRKLKNEEERSKNLISLTLIYRAIKGTKFSGGYCPVRLNTMLAFELYSTFSHHIVAYTDKLDKLYKKQENFDMLSNEYEEIQSEVSEIFTIKEALMELNDSVVKSIRPEILHQIMLDYTRLTPTEHAEKCLL